MNFFVKHKVFYDSHYAFREKQSVIHAVIRVITLIYDRMQDTLHTGILQMDLQKTFDTVSHPILLHKLYHYGTRQGRPTRGPRATFGSRSCFVWPARSFSMVYFLMERLTILWQIKRRANRNLLLFGFPKISLD